MGGNLNQATFTGLCPVVAALKKMDYSRDDKVALIITGHGLKDPEAIFTKFQ